MKYLAIGDGFCAGMGAPFLAPGFVQRHARMLEADLKEKVYISSFARAAYRSKDILELLDNAIVIERIKESDKIVVSSGHQDFLEAMKKFNEDKDKTAFLAALKNCKRNIDDTLIKIREIKGDQQCTITLVGFHNPYEDNVFAEKWIHHFHKHMDCRACSPQVQSLNLFHHFKGNEDKWCTADLMYPNQEGHREIALKLHEIDQNTEGKEKEEITS